MTHSLMLKESGPGLRPGQGNNQDFQAKTWEAAYQAKREHDCILYYYMPLKALRTVVNSPRYILTTVHLSYSTELLSLPWHIPLWPGLIKAISGLQISKQIPSTAVFMKNQEIIIISIDGAAS